VDESAKLYRVVGAGSLVSAGGAATVEAAAGQTVELAYGRDGWGSLAEPTVVTDLNPNVDPPCLP
jgi:hypothetical protein